MILVSQSGAAYQPLDKLEIATDGGAPEVTAVTTLSEDVYHHAVVRPGGSDFAAVHIDGQGVSHLVLGDMVSGDTIVLYQVGAEQQLWQPAWNVDGSELAFFEGERDPPRFVYVRIMDIMAPPGDPGRLQTALSFIWESWSPQNLSWARTANELILDLETLLYRIDLDAATPSLGEPIRDGRMAAWSSDDSKIVFQDDGRIWIGESSGGSATKLARGSRPDWMR
ncbi:MAG: hypothetical protein HKO65_15920 [Gemmatimonadetes bacterium]|nr:hypothetical protein [Gemmatimonadota bacterium]